MTAAAVLAALVVAATDWWAVRTDRTPVETVAKPLTMVMIIAAVIAGSGDPGALRWLLVAALGFGLAGDLLLLPAFDRFLEGLGAFLVGHVLYVIALLRFGIEGVGLLIGAVVALALLWFVGRVIVRATRGSRLHGPVAAYVTVVALVVVFAFGTGEPVVAIGAVLFAGSDALLGHDRFVTPRTDRRVWVHVSYHLGQLALVGGLIAAW